MTRNRNPKRVEQPVAARILDAALAVFDRDGLEGLSMRTVAAAVGMSPMGLYRHYANREALIDAMVERALSSFTVALRDVDGTPGTRAYLRRVFDAYLTFALENRQTYTLLFRATRPSDAPFIDQYKGGGSESFEVLRVAVEKLMENGVFTPRNSVDVAISIWAQAHGLVSLFLAGRFGSGEPLFRRFFDRSMASISSAYLSRS